MDGDGLYVWAAVCRRASGVQRDAANKSPSNGSFFQRVAVSLSLSLSLSLYYILYLTTGLNKWHAQRGPDFAFHFTWVLLTFDGTLGQSVYLISDFQSIMTNQYQRDLEYK